MPDWIEGPAPETPKRVIGCFLTVLIVVIIIAAAAGYYSSHRGH
jgi:hypothetical protein